MKNHHISVLANEITPQKEIAFMLVMDTIFNTYKEVNETLEESAVLPRNVEDLEFEEWFSWN